MHYTLHFAFAMQRLFSNSKSTPNSNYEITKPQNNYCKFAEFQLSFSNLYLGMRELRWNNFRNNDEVEESRIIPEF